HMSTRSNALADRLDEGALALADYASGLTDAQWNTRIPHDGRTVGVVVHHVASVYPIEIELAQLLAAGKPIVGVTWNVIHDMNAGHARDNATVTKDRAIALLRENSRAAGAAIRALDDAGLDRAAAVSLYAEATLSCQFMLEDHAVRHSYHHLGSIRNALSS
ncbi:MAG: DinB family protein, partial [Gemmatimonadota bacterium]